MNEPQVLACIDGSASSEAVCDYAAWASLRLSAPLTLLHVLEPNVGASPADLSGSIGLGSREHLLSELAELDERRARLLREQGKLMLDAATARVRADGVAPTISRCIARPANKGLCNNRSSPLRTLGLLSKATSTRCGERNTPVETSTGRCMVRITLSS